MTDCSVMRIDKKSMVEVLHREHAFSQMFVAYLLTRNIRYEEDLGDQLFNSSEKRLARVLLLLAAFGKDGKPEVAIPKISQETLAEMVGTTRARVSFFMNRFRKLGFVRYNGELEVHSSLLKALAHGGNCSPAREVVARRFPVKPTQSLVFWICLKCLIVSGLPSALWAADPVVIGTNPAARTVSHPLGSQTTNFATPQIPMNG